MDADEIQRLTDETHEAVERGDFVRALALADQLVAMRPHEPDVRILRAETLLKADQADEAFHEARHAVELDPQSERAQTILGLAAWRSARLTLAQQSLERAIELSGRKPGLLIDYAWFMASERGPRLGEEAARRALAAAEHSSTAWAALGMAQFRLHRPQEAYASLKRALELDPNDPYAQAVMVKLLHERRQDTKAMALASLLEDTPGTEELVEEIRHEAKQRQVAMKLVERHAMPEKRFEEPRHVQRWIVIASMMTALLVILFQPAAPMPFLLCVLVPLIVVWLLRKLFG